MSELRPGDVFDSKYEIIKVLGAGGIGTVYQARQIDADRLIALKILHLHVAADDEFKLRFLREAQTLNKFSHSNIVTIYHLGMAESGLLYIAMEFIEGVNLRRLLNESEQKLKTLRCLKITRDAARALEHVHKEGIVHRDLKPDNIVLVDVPDPDTVKIIDFGLARQEMETGNQKLTSTGALIGTVNYMSPEQCAGKRADHRSDIYSLALCLYEMLTGKTVYDADTPMGIMYQHINSPPPQLSSQQLERFSPSLNTMLAKALAKDPQQRFESMEEFAGSLDGIIEELEGSWASSKFPVNIGLLAVVILLLAAGVWLTVYLNAQKDAVPVLRPVKEEGKLKKFTEKVIASEVYIGNKERARQMCISTLRAPSLSNPQRARVLMLASGICESWEAIAYLMEANILLQSSSSGRADRLKANLMLGDFLRYVGLSRQALRCYHFLIDDVGKSGLPEPQKGTTFSYILGHQVQAMTWAMQISLDFSNVEAATRLLEMILSQIEPTDENLPVRDISRVALKLNRSDIVEKLIEMSKQTTTLDEIALSCLRSQKLALAKSAVQRARKIGYGTEGFGLDGHISYRKTLADMAESRYCLEVGDLQTARKLLADQSENLKSTRRGEREAAISELVPLMQLVGLPTAEVEEIGAKQATAVLSMESKSGPLTCAEALSEYDRATTGQSDRQALMLKFKQLLAGKTLSPAERSKLYLLSAFLVTDDQVLHVINSYRELSQNPREIPRATRLRAALSYGLQLNKMCLPTEAQAVLMAVYKDLKENGPEQSDHQLPMDQVALTMLYANLARINLDAGRINDAIPFIERPEFVNSDNPENFLLALELKRPDIAKSILEGQTSYDTTRAMLKYSFRRHDLEMASLCLGKKVALASKETDPSQRYWKEVQNGLDGVCMRQEFDKKRQSVIEMQEIFRHLDYKKLPADKQNSIGNQVTALLYLIGDTRAARKFIPSPPDPLAGTTH